MTLQLHKLRKHFGAVHAVDGLDLEVRSGEILGLLGPNGAGKTTTIELIAGLTRPTSGAIRLDGRPIGPDHPQRYRIGQCPQDNVLYPELTARENLEYMGGLHGLSRRVRRDRATALLQQTELTAKAGTQAEKLSGGMKRRLTLGCALMHDPDVIVLDEPEAGLDPQSRVAMRDFIRAIAARPDKTILLTSHNMDEVDRLADRVAIIDAGRLLALDTPARLKQLHGGGQHLHLTLTDEAAAATAAKALRGSAEGRNVYLRGATLASRLPALLAKVEAVAGKVGGVEHRHATLEDVFLALTGRGLRE